MLYISGPRLWFSVLTARAASAETEIVSATRTGGLYKYSSEKHFSRDIKPKNILPKGDELIAITYN